MRVHFLICSIAFALSAEAQSLKPPDLEAQRAAMKKLAFLVGKWTGEARRQRGPGEPDVLLQTEEAQYKLDGLILVVEGAGRNRADDKPALQAFGVVSYDDASGAYRMRAFNDGRFLETEVKLLDDGKGLSWGFAFGPIRTRAVMKLTEKGDWTELHEIAMGSQAPRRMMEVRVSKDR